MIVDEDIDALSPRYLASRVTVTYNSGETSTAHVKTPKGDPENPMDWDDIEAKFRRLTSTVFDIAQQDDLIAAISNLDQLDSIRQIGKLARRPVRDIG